MAILRGGLFGKISGRIGGLVFSTKNNKTEVRELPKKHEGPVTQTSLKLRAKLKLLAEFIVLFTPFIRIGYPKRSKQRMNAFNLAISENYHHIINGEYPNLEIDYPKITFSKGDLDGLNRLKIDQIDGQAFELKWDCNITWYQCPATDGSDRIYAILYDPIDKRVVEVSGNAMRSDNHFLFSLPEEMTGKKIHMYIFLQSAIKKVVSQTQYQCLDLREPKPAKDVRVLKTSGSAISGDAVKTKKEELRKVTKHLVVPKSVLPKKKPESITKLVSNHKPAVVLKGDRGIRKSIRQKRS